MGNWINVNDRLPSVNGKYLVVQRMLAKYHSVNVAWFDASLRGVYICPSYDVIHSGWYSFVTGGGIKEENSVEYWMSLPEMPEGCGD